MKKIVFIYGTRPELIKLYPVIKEFKKDKAFKVQLISTGQHGKMLDDVHKLFRLKPTIDIGLLKNGYTGLNEILSEGIATLNGVLKGLKNCIVIVQGDTESALAGALAAFNVGIKVYHVEAGLRTFRKNDPFPEEMNRILIDNISKICFTTIDGASNLIDEEKNNYVITGNTIIDAVNLIKIGSTKKSSKKKILVTCHRRENLNEKKVNLHLALLRLSEINGIEIQYVTHPNYKMSNFPGIKLFDPQPYDKFLGMIKGCYFVLTDSGGLQEEAAILGKPCLVMRDCTERTESVELGVSKLIGWTEKAIYEECLKLITDKKEYQKMINPKSKYIYGKPGAGKRIYDYIKKD